MTAAIESLARPVRSRAVMYGPAFVAAIAYVDPGNFATNFAAGSQFGYLLVWVIVAGNLMALLVQMLSAKLGLATGYDLAQNCRRRFPRPVVLGLWAQAELVAIATDLAEVVGGAIALNLLFGLPLPIGGLITGAAAFALLGLESRGYRRFEIAVAGLLLVIILGLVFDTLLAGLDLSGIAGGTVPSFAGSDSVLLATGILGATVMPHVIYLHSSLTSAHTRDLDRTEPAFRRIPHLRSLRRDVLVGLGMAGLANAAMLIIAARLFHSTGESRDTIGEVHSGLGAMLGQGAALAFALALLASGFASSSVGTYAGQVIMSGFLNRSLPLLLRRSITLLPAMAVLIAGADPTQALVWSQVVLSFGIPFALVPLVLFTRSRQVMGPLANRPLTTAVACVIAALVIGLNFYLISQIILG
ncbi:Nramp family divalent metal transporter [Streptomyces canus]|uniref:Nramp family divalent metal transporter n=1 Tax=Streptomyces canus TaxID=58343 RepID=UPI002DD9F4EB|nr:Nramp family divalent metal transporter [Streptomyces canus]WSD82988.1 Nramp family divalent metal transporter [Streptomyces canus]WSD91845.1 Nramp family divalent metal transporter [Streptomyces canus]WSD92663.1 Nramp family divalent metal transporter [Streptomyces canus]